MAAAPRLQRDGSTTAQRRRQLGSGAAAVAAARSAAAAHSATAAARWPQRGDDYLGMTFDYAFEGEVQINMCQYLSKVIEDFPEEITGVSATPAADYLFKVREDGKKLNKEQADIFHHTVACPSFADMPDACMLICCFFSFGGKDHHTWHFLTCGHVRISA